MGIRDWGLGIGLGALVACGDVDTSHLSAADAGSAPVSRRPLFPPVFEANRSHPLVDDFTLRAARYQAKQAPGTPVVANIPLRSHPMWSGNNSLGIEVDLDQDASSTEVFSRTILKLDEWGQSEVWSIALSTNFIPQFENRDQAFALTGDIEWGSGGVVDSIKVDWTNGTVIRLPMNSVSVKLSGAIGTPAGGAVPVDLRARVVLSRNGVPGKPPQFSNQSLGLLGAADPSLLGSLIPRYAKTVIPVAFDRASAALMFAAGNFYEFYTSVGGVAMSAIRAEDAVHYMNEGIPIPIGARVLAFVNTTGPIGRIVCVYNLYL